MCDLVVYCGLLSLEWRLSHVISISRISSPHPISSNFTSYMFLMLMYPIGHSRSLDGTCILLKKKSSIWMWKQVSQTGSFHIIFIHHSMWTGKKEFNAKNSSKSTMDNTQWFNGSILWILRIFSIFLSINSPEIRKAHALTVLKCAVLKISPVWWHKGQWYLVDQNMGLLRLSWFYSDRGYKKDANWISLMRRIYPHGGLKTLFSFSII